MNAGYAYIWEYRVHPDRVSEFLEAYGPTGSWVRLFRKSSGYIRTELFRDRTTPLRFVTVDFWDSRESWDKFRSDYAAAFEQQDAHCGEFTAEEREVGTFEPVTDTP